MDFDPQKDRPEVDQKPFQTESGPNIYLGYLKVVHIGLFLSFLNYSFFTSTTNSIQLYILCFKLFMKIHRTVLNK